MRFSNKFKITYWLIIVIALSTFLLIRLEALTSIKMVSLDPYIFITWCILIALPLFSEISFGGFTFKKELEKVSDDIKKEILSLKLENKSESNNRVNISIEVEKAEKKEYEEKLSKEAKENGNSKVELSVEHEQKRQAVPKSEMAQSRLEKINRIEELVRERMIKEHGENYSPEMKIENNLGKKIILDGIVFYRENKIKEIVEIKFISSKSFDTFKFVWARFVNKLIKLGVDKPIRIIVVSEEMDQEGANKIKQDINFLWVLRKDLSREFRIYFEFFRFENNELTEIILQKNEA